MINGFVVTEIMMSVGHHDIVNHCGRFFERVKRRIVNQNWCGKIGIDTTHKRFFFFILNAVSYISMENVVNYE